MKTKVARIISVLFVPPSFTIILFTIFAFVFESELSQKLILIITAFSFGFVFHIIFFFYLRRKGKLTDEEASIKEERTFPYLISSLFYLSGFFILLLSGVNNISTAFWFCYISNTILIMLINRNWKISAHTMGASGPIAALVFVIGWNSIFLFPLVALIAWARIHFKLHNYSQVIAGALTGFTSTFLQMYIIINHL